MSDNFTIDLLEFRRFRDAFRSIVRVSKRTIDDELWYKSRDLAWKIRDEFDSTSFSEFKPDTPGNAFALGDALGWRVKRDGSKAPLVTGTVSGRRRKGTGAVYQAFSRGQGRVSKQKPLLSGSFNKGILNRRIARGGFLAASWMRIAKAFGHHVREVTFHDRIGRVKIEFEDQSFFAEITSTATGVEIVDRKYNHVSDAFAVVATDMETKLEEKVNKSLFDVSQRLA